LAPEATGLLSCSGRPLFPSTAAMTSTLVRPKRPKSPPRRSFFVWRMTASFPNSAFTREIASCIESATYRLTLMAVEPHHPHRLDFGIGRHFVVRDDRQAGKHSGRELADRRTDDGRAEQDCLVARRGCSLKRLGKAVVEGFDPFGGHRDGKPPLSVLQGVCDLLLERGVQRHGGNVAVIARVQLGDLPG